MGDFKLLRHITLPQREKALRFVKSIPTGRGMVLVQSQNRNAALTLADWRTGADLVFIDPDGKVQKVLTAKAPEPGAKEVDLLRYTVDGPKTAAEARDALPKLPFTQYIVVLKVGESAKFVKGWKPALRMQFLDPDDDSRAYGWEK